MNKFGIFKNRPCNFKTHLALLGKRLHENTLFLVKIHNILKKNIFQINSSFYLKIEIRNHMLTIMAALYCWGRMIQKEEMQNKLYQKALYIDPNFNTSFK